MTRVLVVGTTGMLGSMVYDWLRRNKEIDLFATARSADEARELRFGSAATIQAVDAERGETPSLDGFDWVVNCAGVIKPYIRDSNREEVRRAIEVNSLFPMRLAAAAEASGSMVLQIATDCVYSGRDGNYSEAAAHDATDAYGKTKSMGEVESKNVRHLRCSIIGPQLKGKDSLLHWFLGQKEGASLNGFRNHSWNGVTTLHYAKICEGIITGGIQLPQVQHVVPTGDITKASLLRSFAKEYRRPDLKINDTDAPSVIDRRLSTRDEAANAALWKAAGYSTPPTVEAMVGELARYPFRAE
jgi:dTDP-4-dehydrorhamnose reductase